MRKIIQIAISLIVVYAFVFPPTLLFSQDAVEAEKLLLEGDAQFAKRQYREAMDTYESAGRLFSEIAEKTDEKSKQQKVLLAELKELWELQKKDKDTKALKEIRKEYTTELKERRRLDILDRRMANRTQVALRKKAAAEGHYKAIEQKRQAKLARKKKITRQEAERMAIELARQKARDEKEELRTEKRHKVIVEKELKKTRAEELGIEPAEAVEGEKTEKAKTPSEEKVLMKEAERLSREMEEARKKSESELAQKREEKARDREGRITKKKSIMRARLNRIEEAMFKKRQEKIEKKREQLKSAAIKKAACTKSELDRYAVSSGADQGMLEKGRDLVSKGDSYFEKEMYKEAGKLYDRALLTLRGKYH